MTDNKGFTPGPWWTDLEVKQPAGREIPYMSVYGPLFEIAQVHGNGKGASGGDVRLIAAAPEMYEVLLQVVKLLEEGGAGHKVYEAAKAVVAKAEGRG